MRELIIDTLKTASRQYPPALAQQQELDIPRIAFNIGLTLASLKTDSSGARYQNFEICDLGGGIGLFSVGCAMLGCKRSVLVDDFDDSINQTFGMSILDIHRSRG